MASFEKGANVWYHHPQETWIPTTVSIGGSGELTVKTEDGEVRAEPPLLPQCPLGRALRSRLLTPARCAPPLQEFKVEAGSGNVMPLHPSSLTACEDMVSLGDMNNAALLHNLRLRYWEDDIFVSPAPPTVPLRPAPRAMPRRLSRTILLTGAAHARRTSVRSSSLSTRTNRSRSSRRATWTSTSTGPPAT